MAGSKLWRQWPKSHLYHPTHRPQATIPKVPLRRCAISLPSTSLSPAWLALALETCLPTRRLRSSSPSSWWSLDVSYFLVSCFYFACFYSVTARRKKQHSSHSVPSHSVPSHSVRFTMSYLLLPPHPTPLFFFFSFSFLSLFFFFFSFLFLWFLF